MNKRFLSFLIPFFSLLILAQFTQAQSPTPNNALIQAIQERAQRDAELGKAQQSIAGLDVLFSEEAKTAGLPMREALLIYEDAYIAAKPIEPWWKTLRPDVKWITAAILFLLAVFQNIIKSYLGRFFKWLAETIYKRVAGYKPFWWIALRRYRGALVGKYQEIKIPFRDCPLKMKEIYVPLKVSGSSNLDLIDAYKAVAQYKRLMIIGAPGSGKSMLLKNIALTYAQGELAHFPTQPIPILLELHRLNDTKLSLPELLVQVLERMEFPKAANFIRAGLKYGMLLLLFDGLDEVNSDKRAGIVQDIKDLLDEHTVCRAIVTCRTLVYRGEFDAWAEQKLEIVEFSDQQIQHFLNSWQDEMPVGKSILNLLHNLRERPRIMALARNPLLLTIITYLYTDTPFVLPHSRAEFYNRASHVLLDQWKGERNYYKAAHKQLVLQHLALFNQDNAAQRGQDRRSIDLPTILSEIKKVLPKLNLKDEFAEPILEEIVERSALLISIDGGQKYQFAHLTLQEFFAAKALEGQSNELAARFTADPGAWRETVKLWCGLPQSSTALIREIYARDPITAFEALGDALQVDDNLASKLTASFKLRLGEEGETGNAVMRALAAAAVNPGPRGEALFNFLVALLSDDNPARRMAAADVLALTNLPESAKIMAKHALDRPELRRPLVQMGNLAVPDLTIPAGKGYAWALDDLQTIGTPQAAEALVDMLWGSNRTTPQQAAWRLAALLPKTGVETALRAYPLLPEQRSAESLDWVWEPFETDSASPLRTIAGRVVYLLHTAPSDTIPPAPPPELDPRLIIPLCAVAAQTTEGKLKPLEEDERKNLEETAQKLVEPHLSMPGQIKSKNNPVAAQEQFITENLGKIGNDPSWLCLFGGLDIALQFNLLCRLISNRPVPTINDWCNIFRPVEYDFKGSWQGWGANLALAFLCLLVLWELGSRIVGTAQLQSSETGWFVLMAIGCISLLWRVGRGQFDLEVLASIGFLGFIPVVSLVGFAVATKTDSFIYGAIFCLLGGAFGLPFIYIPSMLIANQWGWITVAVFWLIWIIWFSALCIYGKHRQREAQNPLHGLLDSQWGAAVVRRRAIAKLLPSLSLNLFGRNRHQKF